VEEQRRKKGRRGVVGHTRDKIDFFTENFTVLYWKM
jgi:hypothetical protein